MDIAIRTDAANWIGTGHVYRSLTLALTLKQRGAKVAFVCRELAGNIGSFVKKSGFMVLYLPPLLQSQPEISSSAEWLGLDWQIDAEQTVQALFRWSTQIDWLIIDHYGIDYRWQSLVRQSLVDVRIAVIDDLANRRHDCNILIDQNPFPHPQQRYRDLVPTHCMQLLGLEFLMLRPEFLEIQAEVPGLDKQSSQSSQSSPLHLLVTMGGVDAQNATAWVLQEISNMAISQPLILNVVLGAKYSHDLDLTALQQQLYPHQLLINQDISNIAELMLWADIAISAGGFTCYELIFMGVPSLIIALAPNQLNVAQILHSMNLTWYVGEFPYIEGVNFRESLDQWLIDPIKRSTVASFCHATIDGKGIERVVTKLLMS